MFKNNKSFIHLLIILILISTSIIGGLLLKNNRNEVSKVKTAGTVKLVFDMNSRTATISNEYINIKFNSSGTAYSLLKGDKELIGQAKGFYCSVNGGEGFSAASLKIVTNNPDMADIAYVSNWGELHYVMRSGVSGIYSYFVATGIGTVSEFRTLYRLDGNIFRNGYNSVKSGAFPTIADIKGSTKLQDETYKFADGTVYTKYDWADYESRDHFHGIYGEGYGAWLIPVSNEYYNSGPARQELMVHVDSSTGDGVLLNMLKGSHYGAGDVNIPKGKLYGPWLVYINNGDISDVKSRASAEEEAWPYKWLINPDYPLSRTKVSGTLKITDGRSAEGAMIVFAKPGGEFYTQGEDYIFYSKADSNGNFSIPNIRPGSYTLYAYSTSGDITDQFEKDNINVTGASMNLGTLNWTPVKPTNFLWKIGTADRMSSEFKLGNLSRQYGLPEKVPANLTYTIGRSTEANDWYYAQTKAGSWDVNFNLNKKYNGNGYLTVAVAGVSRNPKVEVYVNGQKQGTLDYSNENDSATYRSANQSGRYRNCEIKFPASLLKEGDNTISFRMTKVGNDGGIMYDIIKLETD